MIRAPRRRLRPALLSVAVAASLCAGAVAVPSPALAAPTRASSNLGDAQAKARALRLAVDRLRDRAEQATEDYDAAYDQLGRVVTAHLSAQQELDNAVSAAQDSSTTASRRVRALYMSGGAPALYATVLDGADINDVLTRLQSVQRVVAGDRSARTAADQDVVAHRKAEQRLAVLAAQRTRLQAAVADHADEVRGLLAQADQLLAQADARVRAIADEQRRQAELAAAQRAATALALAQREAAFATLPSTIAAPTQAAATAIAAAMSHIGTPYLWGATGPDAFDCSGLTLTAYAAAGIALPRTAAEQWYAGPQVPLGDLQPGDLLFWATDTTNPSTIHHVAMYIGNGQMVAAPHSGAQVRVQPVYLDGYIGAVRPSVSA